MAKLCAAAILAVLMTLTITMGRAEVEVIQEEVPADAASAPAQGNQPLIRAKRQWGYGGYGYGSYGGYPYGGYGGYPYGGYGGYGGGRTVIIKKIIRTGPYYG